MTKIKKIMAAICGLVVAGIGEMIREFSFSVNSSSPHYIGGAVGMFGFFVIGVGIIIALYPHFKAVDQTETK